MKTRFVSGGSCGCDSGEGIGYPSRKIDSLLSDSHFRHIYLAVRKAENADDERAACSEAEVPGFYKIPEAMCGVQNECSGDAPAKDGAGHARPKREHKAERHVNDGRPKRRSAEENVFHEDKSFL